jgi:hypothetical protein
MLLLALLTAGCDRAGDRARTQAAEPATAAFVNRVWTEPEPAELPGVMLIFLDDGTLVQDSCWETHRLSVWRVLPSGEIEWDEDGQPIVAEILSVGEDELLLRVRLVDGERDLHFVAAAAPYVCPEVPA